MTRLRLLVTALSIAALLGLSACGREAQEKGEVQAEAAQVAETEGLYVTVDELKYQVQVSRQLNPLLSDDQAYLKGVAEDDAELANDEVWFAIFMRVQNETGEPVGLAEDFEIRDTQENIYRPVELGEENDFAYRPIDSPENKIYPLPNSPAGERPPQGSLLLFKVKRFSLDNRPLELLIQGRSGQEAFVNLDV